MNKQIWSLLEKLQGSLELREYIVQLAACFAWLKLSEDKKLDVETEFTGAATGEQLESVMLRCVTVCYDPRPTKLSDEQLTQIMVSLKNLLKANAITYEDLSNTLKQLFSNAGRAYGEEDIPAELCELGVNLLGDKNNSVYLPFGRGYHFAHQIPETSEVFGESQVATDVFLAEVHSILLNRKFEITQTDPLSCPSFIGDGGLKQFDSTLAFPPLNLKYGKNDINDIWGRFPEKSLMGDVYHLRHMLSQSTDLVVCVVSNGFLFRSAAGEKQFKQDILKNNWLKTVISLPSNLLSSTGISINIVVLDKNKINDTVNFIDASGDNFIEKETRTRNKLNNVEQIIELYQSNTDSKTSKHCSFEEIAENDFNLSPNRYVLSDEEKGLIDFLNSNETAKLEDLVEIIRPQALKHDENSEITFTEYNLASMNNIGEITGEGKKINVNSAELNRANKQTIKPHDILVVCKGAVGKVAIVSEHISENSLASQAFSILRIKPHINTVTSEALYQYLISGFGQLQFKAITTGTSALMIAAKDLNTLQVPLFNAEKLSQIKEVRQQVVDTHNRIDALRNEITILNNSWL